MSARERLRDLDRMIGDAERGGHQHMILCVTRASSPGARIRVLGNVTGRVVGTDRNADGTWKVVADFETAAMRAAYRALTGGGGAA